MLRTRDRAAARTPCRTGGRDDYRARTPNSGLPAALPRVVRAVALPELVVRWWVICQRRRKLPAAHGRVDIVGTNVVRSFLRSVGVLDCGRVFLRGTIHAACPRNATLRVFDRNTHTAVDERLLRAVKTGVSREKSAGS
jgi:hypothetical protein